MFQKKKKTQQRMSKKNIFKNQGEKSKKLNLK